VGDFEQLDAVRRIATIRHDDIGLGIPGPKKLKLLATGIVTCSSRRGLATFAAAYHVAAPLAKGIW
jgi:hypothetical protein